jgi:hypothetical protein
MAKAAAASAARSRRAAPSKPLVRITVPVSDELHYRIRRHCLERRMTIADAIKEVLERTRWEGTSG